MLVPPSENRDFTISLVSLDSPQKYGEVESSFCDDLIIKLLPMQMLIRMLILEYIEMNIM